MVKCAADPAGNVWAGPPTAMPQAHPRQPFSYCNSVMEPWDGPAAICGFAGSWVIAGLDRNGLRPLRYAITEDGLLVAGSEAGMVRLEREPDTRRRGASGPARCWRSTSTDGKFYHHRRDQGRSWLSPRKPLRRLGEEHHRHRRSDQATPAASPAHLRPRPVRSFRRRQVAAGTSRSRIWNWCSSRWSRTPRKPSSPWATTRRSPSSPTTIGACITSSVRNSARSPTHRLIPCARIG